MFEKQIVTIGKQLFKLRYRITVTGLDALETNGGTGGILFLPNHPALIDPLLLSALLYDSFCPRPLADERQMDRPLVKRLFERIRPIYLPDVMKSGRAGREGAAAALTEVKGALKAGDNVLLYPSGAMMRHKREQLGANSAVEQILKAVPDVRVVLVRITGLWGSSFSWAEGVPPELTRYWKRYAAAALAGGLFFIPKREITIAFQEPSDFPYDGDRRTVNRYLERFYNAEERSAIRIPYFIGRKPEPIPEPELQDTKQRDITTIPEETRRIVDDKLKEMTGVETVSPSDKLAADLGLDSLSAVGLMTWIEEEFGVPQEDVNRLVTAADCYLAATGALGSGTRMALKPVDKRWFEETGTAPLSPGAQEKLTDRFLAQAERHPDRVIIGDQLRGEKTYREIVTAALVLGSVFKAYPEKHIGLMLPASGTAAIVYFALLFAEKVPVLVNWTVGKSHLAHSLGTVGVRRVITAEALLVRLKKLGLDYADVGVEFLSLERIAEQLSTATKLKGAIRGRLSWSRLRRARVDDTAAILFTSGSESTPKSVPLTHANLLANMRDYLFVMKLREDDRVLGILPPFHSFGLAGTILLPLCNGLKVVYHANPTEGAQIAQLVAAYAPTFALLTPTFLSNIVTAAPEGTLRSIRIAVTGAEKCPEALWDAFKTACPKASLIEGYGITECAPVVSANDPEHPAPGSIGKLLPSMTHAIVHPETGERITTPGEGGRLLLRGPNVFGGYIGHDGASPFVSFEGEQWYDTGDIVSESRDGVLTFEGRLKRFVKLGGEMISLPAIEAALLPAFPGNDGEIPLAVGATDDAPPQIVLFTTRPVTRAAANKAIAAFGLSPLHSIRQVINIKEIPSLGTGKTDHRALEALLAERG